MKAENPNSSVCWVGSQIGQIWRELTESEKQRYIEEFNKDKVSVSSVLSDLK